MRISSEHVKRNVFLSIFKWGFNPTADPNSQARGQRSEPHHPAPRVGLSLGGGGGGQGGGGPSAPAENTTARRAAQISP